MYEASLCDELLDFHGIRQLHSILEAGTAKRYDLSFFDFVRKKVIS